MVYGWNRMPSNARQTISSQTRQNSPLAHLAQKRQPRGVPRAPKLERDVYRRTPLLRRNNPKTMKPRDHKRPAGLHKGSKISPEEEYICLGYAKATEEEANRRGFFYIDMEEGLLPVHSEALWVQACWNEDTEVFQCTFGEKPTYIHPTTTIEPQQTKAPGPVPSYVFAPARDCQHTPPHPSRPPRPRLQEVPKIVQGRAISTLSTRSREKRLQQIRDSANAKDWRRRAWVRLEVEQRQREEDQRHQAEEIVRLSQLVAAHRQ